MRASCSSIVVDDFDDFNDKSLYSSSNNSISLINDIQNNDFPFFDDYSQEIIKKKDLQSNNEMCPSSCPKSIPYDPQLASLIENELGLNDCQTSRKNAWGNLSYAELIAKAIQNSSQQRLTLSQIYSWMISYIPYFRDKADKKSSTGWKNSIRHNLSLHNCFVRIPNEIAGKSSWWTIDPRAKQVRGRKKNLSNENSTKMNKFDSNKFNSNSTILLNNQKSFTSVRDINKSLYHHLSTQTMTNILHDMLKSSPLQTSNSSNSGLKDLFVCKIEVKKGVSAIGDNMYPSMLKCQSIGNESISCYSTNDYEIISSNLSKQLKTIDRSNPLFRRMVLTIMRHQMNKSKLNRNSREKILSTPPPSSIEDSQLNHNSTFDLDIDTINDFERTTFGDCSFNIHDF